MTLKQEICYVIDQGHNSRTGLLKELNRIGDYVSWESFLNELIEDGIVREERNALEVGHVCGKKK